MTTHGPLSGIKVIDVSEVISGPLGAMILADQGADVIKVERLPWGEETRIRVNHRDGMSALAMNCNHNKRSIGINLKKPEGLAVVHDLVSGADVFVQNWRPGAAERLGLAESDLRKVNPNLVYASVTGYGDAGPYVDRRGYDPIFQALTGWVSSQLNPQVPYPDLVRNAVVDKMTSLTLAQGITAALLSRSMGGPPQHVRVAMLDVALAGLWTDGMLRQSLISEPGVDDVKNFVAPGERYRVEATTDGHVVIWMATNEQIYAALRALGLDDIADHPDQQGRAMATIESSTARADAITGAVAELTTEQVVDILVKFDVPVAPVAEVADVFNDPQIRQNGSVIEDEHEQFGRYRRAHPAARFSETPFAHTNHPPLFAEHTDEILDELGYSAEKRSALRAEDVIAPSV